MQPSDRSTLQRRGWPVFTTRSCRPYQGRRGLLMPISGALRCFGAGVMTHHLRRQHIRCIICHFWACICKVLLPTLPAGVIDWILAYYFSILDQGTLMQSWKDRWGGWLCEVWEAGAREPWRINPFGFSGDLHRFQFQSKSWRLIDVWLFLGCLRAATNTTGMLADLRAGSIVCVSMKGLSPGVWRVDNVSNLFWVAENGLMPTYVNNFSMHQVGHSRGVE